MRSGRLRDQARDRRVRRGFERAQPGGKVRVDYTNETVDPTACERAADAQIDAGSDVPLVQSGPCGAGAVAVARTRGVWAIGADGATRTGHNVLGQIFKDCGNAVYSVVGAFGKSALPRGEDVVLSLEGYNVGLEMLGTLTPGIGSKVTRVCSDIRLHSSWVTIPTLAEPKRKRGGAEDERPAPFAPPPDARSTFAVGRRPTGRPASQPAVLSPLRKRGGGGR